MSIQTDLVRNYISDLEQKKIPSDVTVKHGDAVLRHLPKIPISHYKKIKLCNSIVEGIQGYVKQTFSQKTIWQKIASCFGYITQEERQLRNQCAFAKKMASTLDAEDSSACHQIKMFTKKTTTKLSPVEEIQLLYYAILDASPLEIQGLDTGLNDRQVAMWMLKELTVYKESLRQDNSKIDQIKEELRDFIWILLVAETVSELSKKKQAASLFCRWLMPTYEQWAIQQILDTIHSLQVGQECIIPGGYIVNNFGHAAIYKFQKCSESNFSFSIINTGNGSRNDPLSRDSDDADVFTMFGLKQVDFFEDPTSTVRDHAWFNIPTDAINTVFASILLDSINSTKLDSVCGFKAKNMWSVTKKIMQHFEHYPGIYQGYGQEHKRQKKGSCVIKSLTCWFHHRMEEPSEWAKFKLFYTQRLSERFDHLTHTTPDTNGQKEAFRREIDRVLHKRKRKA